MSVVSPQASRRSGGAPGPHSGGPPPPPQPRADRIHAPSWRSPRLLIGLLLVLASVAGGARVMAAADQTVPVYAAVQSLATGTPLTSSDLVVVRLRLTGTRARYLSAREPLPQGQVLVRPVGAGEVIPSAALAPAGQLTLRPVTIPVDGPLPGDLQAGSLVDIWASAKAGTGSRSTGPGDYLEAQRIASAAEVYAVQTDDRALAASSSASIQILVPASGLQAVLDALAGGAQIAVLPIPGTTR